MRKRTAIVGAAIAALTLGTPALAVENPLVVNITPVGSAGAHGKATVMQLASNVNVDVILDKSTPSSEALDIHKGSCKSYAGTATRTLVAVNGTTQDTKLGNTKLDDLVGNVLLVHKTGEATSPVVGCADLRG